MQKKTSSIFTVILLGLLAAGCGNNGSSAGADSLQVKTADSAVKLQDTLSKMIDSAKVNIRVTVDSSATSPK